MARRSASRRATPRIPADIVAQYGTDALRWWMLSEVARSGDTDYTALRMVNRTNEDLANNIGNLVNRTVSMIHRYRNGRVTRVAVSQRRRGGVTRGADLRRRDNQCRASPIRLSAGGRRGHHDRRRRQPLHRERSAVGTGKGRTRRGFDRPVGHRARGADRHLPRYRPPPQSVSPGRSRTHRIPVWSRHRQRSGAGPSVPPAGGHRMNISQVARRLSPRAPALFRFIRLCREWP